MPPPWPAQASQPLRQQQRVRPGMQVLSWWLPSFSPLSRWWKLLPGSPKFSLHLVTHSCLVNSEVQIALSLNLKKWKEGWPLHLVHVEVRLCQHVLFQEAESLTWYLSYCPHQILSHLSFIFSFSKFFFFTVKRLPAMREIWVRTLGWEDPLEKIPCLLQYSCLENSMDWEAW